MRRSDRDCNSITGSEHWRCVWVGSGDEFKLSPWIVAAFGLGGALFALYARKYAPERYEIMGRIVLADTRERE